MMQQGSSKVPFTLDNVSKCLCLDARCRLRASVSPG
jgi:hypothetical protein